MTARDCYTIHVDISRLCASTRRSNSSGSNSTKVTISNTQTQLLELLKILPILLPWVVAVLPESTTIGSSM